MAKNSPTYIIKQKPEDFIVKEATVIKPCEEGRYSYFLLKKRDTGTIEAIRQIAGFLRMPFKSVGFAGMKDKIAVTEQYISIPQGHEKKIKNFRSSRIELEFVGKGDERINLGDLKGNRFEIRARNAKEPRKIERIVNYFGEQRFSEKNPEIGKAIIRGNLKKAAMLITEKPVMRYLEENRNDYAGALKQLPKKLLTLYINAYQSYLWNTVAGEYLKTGQMDIEIEILGFGTEFRNRKVKEIYERLMKEECITKRDFIVRNIPELSSEGGKRKVFVKPENLKVEKINKKTYRVKFFLPKGCYATEVIRQMFQ